MQSTQTQTTFRSEAADDNLLSDVWAYDKDGKKVYPYKGKRGPRRGCSVSTSRTTPGASRPWTSRNS